MVSFTYFPFKTKVLSSFDINKLIQDHQFLPGHPSKYHVFFGNFNPFEIVFKHESNSTITNLWLLVHLSVYLFQSNTPKQLKAIIPTSFIIHPPSFIILHHPSSSFIILYPSSSFIILHHQSFISQLLSFSACVFFSLFMIYWLKLFR